MARRSASESVARRSASYRSEQTDAERRATLVCSCLGQADKALLLYVHRPIPKKLDAAALERLHAPHPPVELSLELPPGAYEVVRINPVSGERGNLPSLSVKDRRVDLTLPNFHMDAALLLTRQQRVAR